MGELLVAQAIWLLGQDEQWMRPRAGTMPVVAAAAAVLDVIGSGAARWDEGGGGIAVDTGSVPAREGLLGCWTERLARAAATGPLPVIHSVDAVSPDVWELLGADLAAAGLTEDVPRALARWRPPRRRPRPEPSRRVRTRLLDVVHGRREGTEWDEGVLAVASCAGVLEHVLSGSAFTDTSVLVPVERYLSRSDLVPRLEPALSYLTSIGPVLGSHGEGAS
ncbi:GPP34 family phosphoprotein [Phycicoccus avicenniae]|uniref:GPP34 family phosphoprotein n=1 Tax=Phycicoccus avicenniae TaxID=2828860 RepID=UPI003D2CF8E5